MKKLFSLSILLLTAGFTFAQHMPTKSDNLLAPIRIKLSAGLYTSKDIYTNLEYGTNDVWGKNATATYFLSFSFFQHKKLEVGLGLGYQRGRRENQVIFQNGTYIDEERPVYFYTFMPELRLNWIQSEDGLFELYSGASVGITFVDEQNPDPSENDFFPIPAFHINGLGMSFGKTFTGFMEIGMGSRGLLSGGIAYRF